MKLCAARLLVLAFALLAAPLEAEAQQAKVPRIGVLAGDVPSNSPCLAAVRRGLSELGYVEGQTYVLEPRWSEFRTETFPSLAADLVRRSDSGRIAHTSGGV